jgi:hypothetical protein
MISERTLHPPANEKLTHPIVIGKDVLELLSTAMYVDPLTVFREYIQNAADSIDEALSTALHRRCDDARIDIFVDPQTRLARIRDNGVGVRKSMFRRRMTALGASKKRGTLARGFRGVGRLSGLGYCQQLIMRSRAVGDDLVSEISWDCRRFREILRDHTFKGDLNDLVTEVAAFRSLRESEYPEHFFEVELRNVARYRNDTLLNEQLLTDYIAQVGPVPFSPTFSFGPSIQQILAPYELGGSYNIYLNGQKEPIYRPFANKFPVKQNHLDAFTELETVRIPGVSEGDDAIGWILHHGYHGSISGRLGLKGVRCRVGNIQVGSDSLFESAFPEPRFNSWSVGEVHVLAASRLVPNGRRDDFEQNAHYANLLKHLAVPAKAIAKRCRDLSAERAKKRLSNLDPLHPESPQINWSKLREFVSKSTTSPLDRSTRARIAKLLKQRKPTYADLLASLMPPQVR